MTSARPSLYPLKVKMITFLKEKGEDVKFAQSCFICSPPWMFLPATSKVDKHYIF